MTAIIPSTTNTAATAAAVQDTGAKQLAGNFDTFLTLLTTQLKNQDPTSPMDSTAFTQQLVQFSQVEQQINTNSNLKALISQGQSATSAYAVSYLGRTVTMTDGRAALANGAANWTYDLGTAAAGTTLTVTDASGRTVFSKAGETEAGSHSFTWDGTDSNGNKSPDGAYTLAVSAIGANGTAVSTDVASKGVVTQVDLSGNTPQLLIGLLKVPLTSVTTVGTN